MVIIPQAGRLRVTTEMGIIEVEPAEFAVIPPGIKFSVETVDEVASRWINENYGEFLRFPTQA